MTVNLITERTTTYLRRGNNIYFILVVADWQVNFGPVAHKYWPVVALYRPVVAHGSVLLIQKTLGTQNVVSNDRWLLIAVVVELGLYLGEIINCRKL